MFNPVAQGKSHEHTLPDINSSAFLVSQILSDKLFLVSQKNPTETVTLLFAPGLKQKDAERLHSTLPVLFYLIFEVFCSALLSLAKPMKKATKNFNSKSFSVYKYA